MMRKLILIAFIAFAFISCDDNDNTPIVNVARDTYALTGDTLFPEGIDYNPATNLFYTGSTSTGDILQINAASGTVTTLSSGSAQGRKFTTGMKIDSRNRLWVCGGSESKIHLININNGSLLKTWDMLAGFGAGFINDCVIDDSSYIYFTDSRVRKIYRNRITDTVPGNMEEWLTFTDTQIPYTATGTNANGIVKTPGSKYIIIVVSSSGKLYRIDRLTKAISEITLNAPVTGGDGLYMDGNTLYVSRNAANTIVPVTFNTDYSQGTVGTGFGTGLLFNTTIVKAGRYLLAVNGQLNRRATPGTAVLPFSITRVTIP